MKGRDLIIYILENGLENEDILSDEFLKFMPTIESVAVTFNVGIATVETWVNEQILDSVKFNGKTYISPSSLDSFANAMGCKEVDNAK